MSKEIGDAKAIRPEGPKGIGGWLILPLIGLVITIFVGLVTVFIAVRDGVLGVTFAGMRGELLPEFASLGWTIPFSILLSIGATGYAMFCFVKFVQKHHALL